MHQAAEVWEPTYQEKCALFSVWYMGWQEAEQGHPLRTGHNVSTAEQRAYEAGYTAKRAEVLLQRIEKPR